MSKVNGNLHDNAFTRKLRQLKTAKGETTERQAEDIGIQERTLTGYLNGNKPTYDNLLLLIGYYGDQLASAFLTSVGMIAIQVEGENICPHRNHSETAELAYNQALRLKDGKIDHIEEIAEREEAECHGINLIRYARGISK